MIHASRRSLSHSSTGRFADTQAATATLRAFLCARWPTASCCSKCRDAYSLENSDGFTRHNFNALIDNATLADTYFPAFKMTVQEGKALGVMCSCKNSF
jgi:hypothetical protein